MCAEIPMLRVRPSSCDDAYDQDRQQAISSCQRTSDHQRHECAPQKTDYEHRHPGRAARQQRAPTPSEARSRAARGRARRYRSRQEVERTALPERAHRTSSNEHGGKQDSSGGELEVVDDQSRLDHSDAACGPPASSQLRCSDSLAGADPSDPSSSRGRQRAWRMRARSRIHSPRSWARVLRATRATARQARQRRADRQALSSSWRRPSSALGCAPLPPDGS